jgi:hypothetical protein
MESQQQRQRSRLDRFLRFALVIVLGYSALAYLLLPLFPSPPATEMKDQIWHAIADAVSK